MPEAILPWVIDGGALVALHSACGNFHLSKGWFDLVGGHFKSHEGFEFSPKTVDTEHPITKDLPVLKSWDEIYQILVKGGVLWAIGDKKASEFARFKLLPLVTEVPQFANRTHPDIPMMELQKPFSSEDSAARTQVPAGTRLVLFACEPMVVNPIAIDWDTRARAWVVESFG